MKQPKGRNAVVLYLDFDGVLHNENVWWHPRRGPYFPEQPPVTSTLFEHVMLLEELLAPYPEICIVLSTSWVRKYSCAKAAKHLGPRLRQRVIGATFHSDMDRDSFATLLRGQQVWNDVQRRKPADWVALDDTNQGWPEAAALHYIQTHPEQGIAEPAVLETIKERLAMQSSQEQGEGKSFELLTAEQYKVLQKAEHKKCGNVRSSLLSKQEQIVREYEAAPPSVIDLLIPHVNPDEWLQSPDEHSFNDAMGGTTRYKKGDEFGSGN